MSDKRTIRFISVADFGRIADEFAKALHPKDAMICEIHALRAERDTLRDEGDRLRTFVFVSGRRWGKSACGIWIKKYGPRSGVPTPEALADFAELTEAYNALPKVQP